ncbi:MAG: MmgE/PrpD family protein [Candidatus Binatia bacterium]
MPSRSSRRATISEKICEFIARTDTNNIPLSVRHTAKLHLLDGLAVILAGAAEGSSKLLRRHLVQPKTRAEATVFGTPKRYSAQSAALLNGFQGHVLDYDDAQLTTLASRPTGQQTHPTVPVLAAALAVAESRRLSMTALIDAYIVGVEVACRLGDAVDPSHYREGFHPTGTLGVFGATAACAHLLELPRSSTGCALGIAGTLASGLRANRGTMAKGLNAGHAAKNGVLAATLAARGFTASQNIFDDSMGFFRALCRGQFDPVLLHFGKPFFFAKPGVAIKLYPCAGVLHPALDLLLELRKRHLITPDQIDTIRVKLDNNAAAPLVYDAPTHALQAKFSLQFAVAVAMLEGAAGLRQFTMARLRERRAQDLMKRIELVRLPVRRGKSAIGIETEIEIKIAGGAVYHARSAVAGGHPRLGASRAQVEEKFRQCVTGILSARRADDFLKKFWDLERARSLRMWLRSLQATRR